ncbi:MAG: hypothetical protein HQM12_24180, partial [SAR324 cluster bacterium]|nr:hypothetical protein [SAR324 cluster bacterium]
MRFIKLSSRKGIALLLTLVILMLISIYLTEFTFETTLEVQAMQSFESAFKARGAAKSMFKAILVGLESEEEPKFFIGLRQIYQLGGTGEVSVLNPPPPIALPEGILPDFEDVTIYAPIVRPIDHLFDLNRIQSDSLTRRAKSKEDWLLCNQFYNAVSVIQIPDTMHPVEGQEVVTKPLESIQILSIYAGIFDWMDKNSTEPYSPDFGA